MPRKTTKREKLVAALLIKEDDCTPATLSAISLLSHDEIDQLIGISQKLLKKTGKVVGPGEPNSFPPGLVPRPRSRPRPGTKKIK